MVAARGAATRQSVAAVLALTSSHVLLSLIAVLGVQALTSAAVLLAGQREHKVRLALPFLVSGAAGVLLATACLDLLPEAVLAGGPEVWETLLLSLLFLYCAQAIVQSLRGSPELYEGPHVPGQESHEWAHPKPDPTGARERTGNTQARTRAAPLILGSALHSTVDGVAIAAAFSAGKRPGWSAAAAILLHELPHRLGDFSLLLHLGLSRRSAAGAAIGAGAAALLGWWSVLAFGQHSAASHWMLPVSAGTFLYIALADLVPELQAHRRGNRMWWEVVCLLGGAAFMALVTRFPGE